MSIPHTSKSRTKPAAQRRGELMNAAERLFLKNGYEPTTVQDITMGADVAKGTFYLHFSSKDDILQALRQRFVDAVRQDVADEVGRLPPEKWHDRLATWSSACATRYLEATDVHRMVFASGPPAAPEGLTSNVLIDDLEALLAAGVHAGAWSIDDPRFTAVFLFNALHAVVADGERHSAGTSGLLSAIREHFFRCVGL